MARPISFQFHGSGKTRQVYFGSNAIAELEGCLGMPFQQALRKVGFREVRACLWAGMLATDPTLTLEGVGLLMDEHFEHGGRLDELMTVVLEGWTVAVKRMGAQVTIERGPGEGEAREEPDPQPGV